MLSGQGALLTDWTVNGRFQNLRTLTQRLAPLGLARFTGHSGRQASLYQLQHLFKLRPVLLIYSSHLHRHSVQESTWEKQNP